MFTATDRISHTSNLVEGTYRNAEGQLHATTALARIIKNTNTDVNIVEQWYLNGKLHRDPTHGPAEIVRAGSNGALLSEAYWINGAHPEGFPARVTHYY